MQLHRGGGWMIWRAGAGGDDESNDDEGEDESDDRGVCSRRSERSEVEVEEGDASDEVASGGDASPASCSSSAVSEVLSEGAWAFFASSAS